MPAIKCNAVPDWQCSNLTNVETSDPDFVFRETLLSGCGQLEHVCLREQEGALLRHTEIRVWTVSLKTNTHTHSDSLKSWPSAPLQDQMCYPTLTATNERRYTCLSSWCTFELLTIPGRRPSNWKIVWCVCVSQPSVPNSPPRPDFPIHTQRNILTLMALYPA